MIYIPIKKFDTLSARDNKMEDRLVTTIFDDGERVLRMTPNLQTSSLFVFLGVVQRSA